MADNVPITPGSGANVATDDCGAGGHAQIFKQAISTDGSVTLIPSDATFGLDVDVTRIVALPAGDNNIGNVDVVTLPALPAGTNNIGDVDVLTLPALVAGTANIGDVDVLTVPADPFGANADAASATGSISAKLRHLAATGIAGMTALPAGANNIGDVDVLTLPALPAGNNNIGDVDVASIAAGDNNIGNVDIVTLPALAAGSNTIGNVIVTDGTRTAMVRDTGSFDSLCVNIVDGSGTQITGFGGGTEYDEDTVHSSGDKLSFAGVVQQTADAALSGNGDRSLMQVDETGWLKVNVKAGGTAGAQFAEDTVHVSGDLSTMAGVVQQTADAALSGDGDRSLMQVDASGWLKVNVKAGSAAGTQYTEDAAAASDPVGTALIARRRDSLSTETTTDGDNTAANCTGKGELYVKHVDTLTVGSHAVTNAGVFAVQVDGSALTSLQLIDDSIATTGSAITTKGMAAAGTDGTNARILKTDSSGELQIDVLTLPALVASSANIGDVDVLTLPAIPTGTNTIGSVKITDGTNVASVRDLGSADALNVAICDGSGGQIVGVSEYTEDAASASNPAGPMLMARRRDSLATETTTDGDNTAVNSTGKGEVYVKHVDTIPVTDNAGSLTVDAPTGTPVNVQIGDGTRQATVRDTGSSDSLNVSIVDGSGNQITSFGGGTQYTEDAAAAADPVGNLLILRRRDSLSTETTTDGDNTGGNCTGKGELYVKHIDAIPVTDNGGALTVDGTVAISGTVTVGSHAVTNAGVFAVQVDGAALTSLQLIDDGIGTIASATPTKGMVALGHDGTNARALKTDTGGELQVDVLTVPAITNTGTFVVQENGAALTALQLIDDGVATTGSAITAKGMAACGTDGTNARVLKTDTSGELQIDVLTLPALVAGSANIGDVDILSIAAGDNNIGNVDIASIAAGDNNIGNVDVVTLPALVAGTANIGDVDLAQANVTADTTLQNAVSATGNGSSLTVTGYGRAIITVTGTFSATVLFEASNDAGTTWFAIQASSVQISGGIFTAVTVPGIYAIDCAGLDLIRTPVTWTSGTSVTVKGRATNAVGPTHFVKLGQGGNLAGSMIAVGDIAHDLADSGNPVKVGGKAANAFPTAVANNDRTNFLTDLFGRQLTSHIDPAQQIWKAVTYTSAQTGTSIWDPTTDKRIAITAIQIGSYGTTAGRLILWFGASGDTTYSVGSDQVAFAASFAPSATSKPGAVSNFAVPIFCNTANHELRITTVGDLSVDITVYGYEF